MSAPDVPDLGDDLEPDLRALLDAERDHAMPEAARARLFDRLDAETGGALSRPDSGGPGPGGGGEPATNPASAAIGAGTRRLLFGLSTFALGTFAGALGHALLSPQRPQPVALQLLEPTAPVAVAPRALSIPLAATAPAPAPAEVPDAGPASERRSRPAAAAVAVVAAAPAAAPSDAPPSRDSDLAAERAVLDIAHTAIARGDSKATLDALARHSKQFPGGRMQEERESLYVQALVQAGRYADARERAARFQKHYPTSLLKPAVEAALAAIP